MTDLTHVDRTGAARMVDVSAKDVTARFARAAGSIRMQHDTLNAIRENTVAKGDVLSVARVAGIMAAKRTSELVPLCHPLPITSVELALTMDEALPGIRAESRVRTVARTGVEMEALVAITVALVTVYDMVKAIDREMTIEGIAVVEKTSHEV